MADVAQAVEVAAADPSVQLVMNKLEQFCSGIGMKVEQFFPYLIKQQEVIFYMGVSKLLIALFLSAVMIFVFHRISKGIYTMERDFNPEEHGEDLVKLIALVLIAVGGIVSLICFFVIIMNIPSLIGRIINPEFYAVQQAMEIAGNLFK